MPSYHRSTTLPILASDPIWLSPRSGYLESFSGQATAFSKSERAFGGWWDCGLTVPVKLRQAEDWLMAGLGRNIDVHNLSLVKIGSYFVNKITLTAGGDTDSVGPLLDIANRLTATHNNYDPTVNPPVSGTTQPTATVNDTNSQALYGIIEKIINVSEANAAKAEQGRDTTLTKYKRPQTSQNVNLSGSDAPQLRIECLGYVHLLDSFYYTLASTAYVGISTKLASVLAAHPGGLFSSDTLNILSNTFLVPAKEDGTAKGLSIVRDMVDLGDTNDNPYVFGIYEGRKAYYQQVPSVIDYHRRRAGNRGGITNTTGRLIYPWDVQAGKWVFREDFLTGYGITSSLFDNPRTVFIDAVTYTAPWDLQIDGGKADTITQRLKRMGLGGGV